MKRMTTRDHVFKTKVSTHFLIVFIVTWKVVSDPVSHVLFPMGDHVVVEVSFVPIEDWLHLFAASEPMGEATERFSGGVRVLRLNTFLHLTFRHVVLIVIFPDDVEIAVDLERFAVADVEVVAPASEGLTSSVGREPSSFVGCFSLSFEPPESVLDGGSHVIFRVESIWMPSRVTADLSWIQLSRDELVTCDWTRRVPADLYSWAPSHV